MCGQLRVCSLGSLAGRRSSNAPSPEMDHPDGVVHIIPRQNKGVCTLCDVTVWLTQIVVDGDGRIAVAQSTGEDEEEDMYPTKPRPVEIKWCKGCKNFRSWAAFGEKGSATKCVRCRNRQKEKYALQKNNQGGGGATPSNAEMPLHYFPMDEKKEVG